jgi:hypothetical protein
MKPLYLEKPYSDVSWVTFCGKKLQETLPPDLAPSNRSKLNEKNYQLKTPFV